MTAVPAEHGPPGLGEITGPVTGFVVSGADVPTVYVSGDNASLDAVREVADRFPASTWRCCSAVPPGRSVSDR